MQNPHDRFFRHVLSDPDNAAGELAVLLPPELAAQIDWSSLRLVPGSYVDAELSELRSDLLFAAEMGGRPVLFYVLLEHQSSPHPRMPLKLLGYMVRIWEDHLRDHPDTERLPVIVPAVVYHGDGPWNKPLSLMSLLDVEPDLVEVLRPHIPDFDHQLDDLSSVSAEDLHARAMTEMTRLALFCLKRARAAGDLTGELSQSFLDRMRKIAEAPDGVTALSTVLRYILEASETPPEHLRRLVRKLGPRAEEAFMTGAQILQAEAEAKGRAEGRAELLLKLLALRFGELPGAAVERVRAATADDLDRWAERVLTATSLQDTLDS